MEISPNYERFCLDIYTNQLLLSFLRRIRSSWTRFVRITVNLKLLVWYKLDFLIDSFILLPAEAIERQFIVSVAPFLIQWNLYAVLSWKSGQSWDRGRSWDSGWTWDNVLSGICRIGYRWGSSNLCFFDAFLDVSDDVVVGTRIVGSVLGFNKLRFEWLVGDDRLQMKGLLNASIGFKLNWLDVLNGLGLNLWDLLFNIFFTEVHIVNLLHLGNNAWYLWVYLLNVVYL